MVTQTQLQLEKQTLVFWFNSIELFCEAAFRSGCNKPLGRCWRKYSIIVFLKAVETTNLQQQMKVP